MSDLVPEVEEKEHLGNHVLTTLEHLKSFHMTLSSLMIEVSAIRKTLLTTQESKSRYKKNLAGAMKKARPLIDEAVKSYDNLIELVAVRAQPDNRPPVPEAIKIH